MERMNQQHVTKKARVTLDGRPFEEADSNPVKTARGLRIRRMERRLAEARPKLAGADLELRAQPFEASNGNLITGYAAVFHSETVIAGEFRERIAPGAFARSLRENDVRALLHHDKGRVIGRMGNGTLRLSEDAGRHSRARYAPPGNPLTTHGVPRVSTAVAASHRWGWFQCISANETMTLPLGKQGGPDAPDRDRDSWCKSED
ncbi:HK97 family phage prohead protease [Aurantimonas sp. C2-5-R2]|uniref:HK97 family phage prohead protease n=1 Tax=Aurantimonas sp. C2-5-R2 TaxID=3113713 RepID=UPI002F923FC7